MQIVLVIIKSILIRIIQFVEFLYSPYIFATILHQKQQRKKGCVDGKAGK